MALAGGGVFHTQSLTPHTTTNIDILRRSLNVEAIVTAGPERACRVEVKSPEGAH